jgi:hypothetical protein
MVSIDRAWIGIRDRFHRDEYFLDGPFIRHRSDSHFTMNPDHFVRVDEYLIMSYWRYEITLYDGEIQIVDCRDESFRAILAWRNAAVEFIDFF